MPESHVTQEDLFASRFRISRGKGGPAMKLRFVVVFVLLLTAVLEAQTFRGTILGTVTDPAASR